MGKTHSKLFKKQRLFVLTFPIVAAIGFVVILNFYAGLRHHGNVHPRLYDHHLSNFRRRKATRRMNNSSRVHRLPPKVLNSHSVGEIPRLDSLVQGWDIVGNVSWLLDFAIVGFPKCGTTSLMQLLANHTQVQIFDKERCDLSYNRQSVLATDLYQMPPPNNSQLVAPFLRGLKCPLDLDNAGTSLPVYLKYFPHVRFVVGLRHPVLWFESFYNHRIHNQLPMPPPNELVGNCRRGNFGVCTYRSNFHLALARLGKTTLSSRHENSLFDSKLQPKLRPLRDNLTRTTIPVFLYEVSQLRMEDESDEIQQERYSQFRRDLQSFLGLTKPLGSTIPTYRPGQEHPPDVLKKVNAEKMDICADEFTELRNLLLRHARQVSTWILSYFLHSQDVVVSSEKHFMSILKGWSQDPCWKRQDNHGIEKEK